MGARRIRVWTRESVVQFLTDEQDVAVFLEKPAVYGIGNVEAGLFS